MLFTDRDFRLIRLEEQALFEDVTFDACRFFRCVIEPRAVRRSLNLDNRIVFSNCQLRNCTEDRCLVGPVIFRRCLVDGLQSSDGGMRINGAFLDQVTIRGSVGHLRILSDATYGADSAFDFALHQANQKLYSSIGWAIDITDAYSDNLVVYGVPPELLRYDPQRQAVIRRANVEDNYSDATEACGQTFFGACIDNLQYFPTADNVCVTIPASGDIRHHQEILTELRRLGFAD